MGEVYYRSCLTLLPGSAWVMLSYVLHALFAAPVEEGSVLLRCESL